MTHQTLPINKTYPGGIFKGLMGNIKLYKLLFDDLTHFDFEYKDGLNTDHIPFNPNGECSPGGLYFADEHQLRAYSNIYISQFSKFARVTIPNDAKVYVEKYKYKADKIIINNIRPISNLCNELYLVKSLYWPISNNWPLSSDWYYPKIVQQMGRAVRNSDHSKLPIRDNIDKTIHTTCL